MLNIATNGGEYPYKTLIDNNIMRISKKAKIEMAAKANKENLEKQLNDCYADKIPKVWYQTEGSVVIKYEFDRLGLEYANQYTKINNINPRHISVYYQKSWAGKKGDYYSYGNMFGRLINGHEDIHLTEAQANEYLQARLNRKPFVVNVTGFKHMGQMIPWIPAKCSQSGCNCGKFVEDNYVCETHKLIWDLPT